VGGGVDRVWSENEHVIRSVGRRLRHRLCHVRGGPEQRLLCEWQWSTARRSTLARRGLDKAVNEILADPKVKAKFSEYGAFLIPGSAAEFGKLVVDETEKWAKVVKFAGARVE
jgi:hypothetical protein